MLEKKVEERLRKEIKKMGGVAYKFVSPGNAGVPDRIILLPGGRIYFVELKRLTGTVSPLQKKMQIKKIADLGFDVRILRGLDEVEGFIDEIRTT